MRKYILLLAILPAWFSCSESTTNFSEKTEQPNIIYILADDLGYRELGSYGQEIIKTPSLDKLAEEGMRFTQHYSGSPVCAPSRCVLLTSRHTGNSYIRDNYELGGFLDENEGGQMPLPPNTPNIASMLKEVGYTTGVIGKWGLGGPGSTGVPNKQGFDYFYGYLCQKQAHNYYPTHLWENNVWDTLNNIYFHPHQRFEGEVDNSSDFDKYKGNDYAMDKMAEKAEMFIRENQDDPFFLYLPFPVPHLALQVPDEALDMYPFPEDSVYLGNKGYLPHERPLAAYAAMITRMDEHIGKILTLVADLGLEDNTVVMFSSDNGATFDVGGVNRFFFNSVGELNGHKGRVLEGGIRVPFIVKWPGNVEPGTVSDHISAFWDILPTVRDITGASYPYEIDGISLLPTLLGESNQSEHEFLYWEYHAYGAMQAVRMGNWKGIRLNTREEPDGPIALYNLETDVGETTDVSEQYPDIVAQIEAAMASRTRSHVKAWNPAW